MNKIYVPSAMESSSLPPSKAHWILQVADSFGSKALGKDGVVQSLSISWLSKILLSEYPLWEYRGLIWALYASNT